MPAYTTRMLLSLLAAATVVATNMTTRAQAPGPLPVVHAGG